MNDIDLLFLYLKFVTTLFIIGFITIIFVKIHYWKEVIHMAKCGGSKSGSKKGGKKKKR